MNDDIIYFYNARGYQQSSRIGAAGGTTVPPLSGADLPANTFNCWTGDQWVASPTADPGPGTTFSGINARDHRFGARGDLVWAPLSYNQVSYVSGADDAPAIQAALNAAGDLVSSDKTRDQAGNAICFVGEGDYCIRSQLVVPPNVVFHCEGWLYNFLADPFMPMIQGMRHSHARKIQVHANSQTGVLWGEAGSDPCASNLESVVVWHAGTDYDGGQSSSNQRAGLRLRGLDFRLGHVWIKGGNVGLHGDGASDVQAARVFLIGSSVGMKIDSGEQWSCPNTIWDTNITYGLAVDNSSNVRIEGEAFVNSDAYGTPMTSVVRIGQYTGAKNNANIRVKVAAQSTGGYGAILAKTEDCVLDLVLSNSRTYAQTGVGGTSHWDPSGSGVLLPHNIGTQYFFNAPGNHTEIAGAAVKYEGNHVGFLSVDVRKSAGIALSEGAVVGSLRDLS